ncbi:MAG: NIPSNAP family protein, partial [Terriglobia bacterium]
MTRRDLLSGSLAASAFANLPALGDSSGSQGGAASAGREFYELKRYQLRNGPEPRLVDSYLREAAVPALNRAGIKPVGVFRGMVGPENPAVYVLIPYPSLPAIGAVQSALAQDEEYQRQAADYLNAPASQPAYTRFETWLLEAFETVPHIEVPPAAAEHRPRIFELRTYENPSEKANLTKLKMFNTAEISIFRRTGLRPVFFGNTLLGSRMPCLTYMLTFENLAEREKNWGIFGSDPEWKKLSTTPGYT